jgi:hypothetical protein
MVPPLSTEKGQKQMNFSLTTAFFQQKRHRRKIPQIRHRTRRDLRRLSSQLTALPWTPERSQAVDAALVLLETTSL